MSSLVVFTVPINVGPISVRGRTVCWRCRVVKDIVVFDSVAIRVQVLGVAEEVAERFLAAGFIYVLGYIDGKPVVTLTIFGE